MKTTIQKLLAGSGLAFAVIFLTLSVGLMNPELGFFITSTSNLQGNTGNPTTGTSISQFDFSSPSALAKSIENRSGILSFTNFFVGKISDYKLFKNGYETIFDLTGVGANNVSLFRSVYENQTDNYRSVVLTNGENFSYNPIYFNSLNGIQTGVSKDVAQIMNGTYQNATDSKIDFAQLGNVTGKLQMDINFYYNDGTSLDILAIGNFIAITYNGNASFTVKSDLSSFGTSTKGVNMYFIGYVLNSSQVFTNYITALNNLIS